MCCANNSIYCRCLRDYDPSVKFMRKLFDELFEVFDEEREEHERTYDEEQMRDFMDVYIKECRQANKEGNKGI